MNHHTQQVIGGFRGENALIAGLQEKQSVSVEENQVLLDRLAMIENQVADQEVQLGKILDLYLTGDFERSMLTERKLRLENNIINLRKEHLEISSTIEKLTLTDSQISEIQEFCDGIRDRVDTANFDEKRQLLELFDVRGKLATENNEKVIYATCLLQPQPVSLALTSHLLNIGGIAITIYASHPTAPSL